MLRRILVPLDGSAFAEHALSTAIDVARAVGGHIRLVNVVEKPSPFVFPQHAVFDHAQRVDYLIRVAERVRDVWAGKLSTSVREGRVEEEMEAEAKAWRADLMVMTTYGRTGVYRTWIGSVADRCVRGGFCPVLLVRPPTTEQPDLTRSPSIDRVVVPLDGSRLAERALGHAMAAAYAFDIPVLLLHIASQPAGEGASRETEPPERTHETRADEGKDAMEYLNKIIEHLRYRRIAACAHVGTESDSIQVIADRAPGDIVVMCTCARRAFDTPAFGSVADRVVRTGSQPVLVIPVAKSNAMEARIAATAAL